MMGDDMNSLFAVSPEEEALRSHYANLSARLADETIAHASSWCEQTPITTKNDVDGPAEKLIVRFAEHLIAQALADQTLEPLRQAARAALLLTHIVGDNPRAKVEGGNDRVLFLVIEAALQLGTTFAAIAPTEPREVIHTLLEPTEPSHILNNAVVLVERWGTPLLAPLWNDTRATNRPEPFAAFDWWESRFPWDQVGPVTVGEPAPNELTADERSRRLATEFARTGDIALGLESVREAIRCDRQDPAWMGLWVANHHAGSEGVAAFNAALAEADLPPTPNWTRPSNDQLGDTIVTDPWAGPFFDRSRTS